MSREIEADYIENYHNEEKHCHLCDSFTENNGNAYCKELEMEINPTATCDFFRSKD